MHDSACNSGLFSWNGWLTVRQKSRGYEVPHDAPWDGARLLVCGKTVGNQWLFIYTFFVLRRLSFISSAIRRGGADL
jgi:hypothetical protein